MSYYILKFNKPVHLLTSPHQLSLTVSPLSVSGIIVSDTWAQILRLLFETTLSFTHHTHSTVLLISPQVFQIYHFLF